MSYGAKCHLCADLLGTTHAHAPVSWLNNRQCPDCLFCQERELSRAIQRGGLGLFDPEVRAAVHAFERGQEHPLIAQLRSELQDEANGEGGVG